MIEMMEPTNEDQYLTVEQVMNRLQLSRDTIMRLINQKKLRAKKIGRVYRISEKWLDAYMNEDTGTSQNI